MTKVYIAGPMSGYPEHNFPAFDAARDWLKDKGYEVVSPADISRASGVSASGGDLEPLAYAKCMRDDIGALLSVDQVWVLAGWKQSNGAKLEVQLAHVLCIPVIDTATLEEIPRGCIVANCICE